MGFSKIEKGDRFCDVCGKRFLSGLAHIERGSVMAKLCYECSAKDSSLGRFKRLTKAKWAKHISTWKQNA